QGKFHPEFERMDSFGTNRGGDCANFVSQLLHAGGLKMNDDWYYEKGTFIRHIPILNRLIKYFSPKWAVADEQYCYFSDKNNGYSEKTFQVASIDDLRELEEMGEIKPGDLLYWDYEDDGKMNHATIITNVNSGQLKYSGHTNDTYNKPIVDTLIQYYEDYGIEPKLRIVKMKDQIEIK
ncbi:amidase domain-containing protein, partial [Thermoactinomyces mirandus]